ncbi:hypothetical protein [Nocardia sp. CA-120079]|uniref:hypothetical protein n=1 Tax=Nocardia sp. CA-120079 TaxID=3239974 RepID=UPI003D966021
MAERMPAHRHVVFVDWWCVLSPDCYWQSICADPHHPIRDQLMDYISEVLAPDSNQVLGTKYRQVLA